MVRVFWAQYLECVNMASITLEDRLEKVNSLKNFILSVEERVKAIANELNWSYESLTQEVKSLTVSCSVHPEHKVLESRINEHEEKCQWLKDGYHADDLPFPENHGQGSCVVFTPEVQETIIRNSCSQGSQSLGEAKMRGIPQTSARLDQDFTREEKLALYDYVIANTKGQKLYKEIASMSVKEEKNEKKVMTPLEIAAAERDAKRRRASYRNKVHTNRKTQTEILREVIDSQMETLKEQISDPVTRDKDYKEQYNSLNGNESDKYNRSESSKREYSGQGYLHHGHDRSHKKSHYKDERKYHSDRDSKYRHDSDHRESKHKNKKHKRSRSRSRSQERSKPKKSKHSDHHSSHRSSIRY